MAIRISGMNSGMDTDAMVKDLVAAYEKKGQKTKNAQTKLKWKQDIWKDLNKKIKSFNSKIQNMKFSSAYASKKTTSSDESKVSVVAGDKAVTGTQTLEVKNLAKTAYLTGGKIGAGTSMEGNVKSDTKLSDLGFSGSATININKGGKTTPININDTMTIDDVNGLFKEAGIDASFDESSGRIFMAAKESGEKAGFSITQNAGNADALKALGLYTYSEEELKAEKDALKAAGKSETLADVKSATFIAGEDAVIKLNGATFTSNTNTISVNGLAITAKDVTSGPVTITTDTDYDAIYDNIKKTLKEYSSLINELDKLYNADRAKGFDPLTDEEKAALSDKEVEQWETKIKDSLLRRDENVGAVASAMKNAGLVNYEVGEDKKKYSLSDFGIGTLSYFISEDNQKNALHIDGDADDEDVSGNTNKLKNMLMSDTAGTIEFFTKYFSAMSENMDKLSKSTSSRSFGNFYDDKTAASDLSKYEKKVADFEDYLSKIEDKYYKQFTRMEKEMSKLNSTQTSLSQYFGG